MPEIKVKHVVSFSSEDKSYQAENMVKSDGYKKWKTAKPGEKKASVTLQFEKATKIHKIDIGNESSAFVEVLVGKTGMQEDDFQVLLVASSFMNPMESRGGQNGTRVRIFASEELSQTSRDEKWDRIKIVCTQPFNKGIQYGLSFVKFHSPPDPCDQSDSSVKKLGAFAVKDDKEEDISAGSLFAQRKEKKEPVALTGAAAVRAASKLAEESKPQVSTPRAEKPGTSKVPTPKRKHSPEPSESKLERKRDTPPVKLQKQSTSISSVASTSSRKSKDTPTLKRTKTEPAKQSKEKEFSKLMGKVVFVISGFQNPYRTELRDKAVEMGAVFKPDWGKNTTHLICAFENTPKYSIVKGKGKIVRKEWLLDCYKSKQLLPWRKYRLGKARTPPGTSDESSEDEYVPAQQRKVTPAKHTPTKHESSKGKATPSKGTPKKNIEQDYNESTDDLSGMDTEDELEKLKSVEKKESKKSTEPSPKKGIKHKSPAKASGPSKEKDIYNVSTDEEMDIENTKNGHSNQWDLDDLPDLFTDKKFFLYGKFSNDDRRTIIRYITAYDGTVEEYMNDIINYVITDSEWDKNFDDAVADNPGLSFVKSQWIYSCHDKQKMLPYQKYMVVPK